MPSYSSLDNPTSLDFAYYGTDAPPSRIFVGRTFLAGAHYDKPKNEKEETKREYGKEFFREIDNSEVPYNEVIVTWHALANVIAHLDSQKTRTAAIECLQRFQ